MEFSVDSVDYEPDDLAAQLPLRGRLLRQIAGPDRPDYWLATLDQPISWTKDGLARTIRHLVLKARWEGTAIGPGAKIPVGLIKYTLAGVPLGWIFWRWSLPYSILCHVAANAVHLAVHDYVF